MDGRASKFPVKDIERVGPFDLSKNQRSFDKLRIGVLGIGKIEEQKVLPPLRELLECDSNTTFDSPTLKTLFSVDAEITLVEFVERTDEVKEFIQKFQSMNSQDDVKQCVIILHGKGQQQVQNQARNDFLIQNIPKQGINTDTFIEKVNLKQRGYFRNILLGIYAKIGGQAWILNENHDPSIGFIGYQSLSRKDKDQNQVTFVLNRYSNTGTWEYGSLNMIEKEEFENHFIKELSAISKDREYVRFMNVGSFWPFEKEVVSNISEQIECDFQVYEMITNKPLRIYSMIDGKAASAKIGMGIRIDSEQYGVVTTFARRGTVNPLVIRRINGHGAFDKDDVRKFFDLTQCYTGYENLSLKLPVPCHASQQALHDARGLKIGRLGFENPWFI